MNADRWRQIQALFVRCLDLEEPERAALLQRECAADEELKRTLAGMLRADSVTIDPLRSAVHGYAQSVAVPEEEWQGRQLGAYTIERLLGAGGMGMVFLGRRHDAQYDRIVAIKVLASPFASREVHLRFLAERQILANFAHPYIAQLHDGGAMEDGRPYLVMEYIEGLPIDRWCDERQLTLAQRLALFRKVCEAVQYAHQNLVIHSDIKPSNILVMADGTPKLLDFGIASRVDASTTGSAAGMVHGARMLTPRHASPEQLAGLPITTACDVYSLGVLLYQLVAGTLPFAGGGERLADLERAVLETLPRRPSKAAADSGVAGRLLPRQLAGDIDSIVLKALCKDPAGRYETVREFGQDIENCLSHRPVAARAALPGYRVAKFLRRHRGGVAMGTIAAAALIVLVGFHTWRLANERDLQARARATADAVSQFMIDIFRVADPASGSENITARELLESASERVHRDLQDQPDEAARLMLAMGRAYGGLALHDRAVELAEEALTLRQARLPADHPDVAEALFNLGNAQGDAGDFITARANLERSLTLRERSLGESAPEVGESLLRLAFVQMRQTDYPAMKAGLDRALAIFLASEGPDARRTIDTYSLIGSYYYATGQPGEAQENIQRALAAEERAASQNKARQAALVHNLALAVWQSGDFERALDLYQRELALREQQYGPDHPEVALPLYGLANSYANMQRYDEAIAHYQRAVDIQEARLTTDNQYHLAMTWSGFGFALLGHGDFRKADSALKRALEIYEKSFGLQHLDLRAPLAGLSKVALAERRFDDAQRYMERALGIVGAALAPDHPDMSRTRISMGDVFHAQGDHARAAEFYAAGVAAMERTLGLKHPWAAPGICGLMNSYRQLGQAQQATQLQTKAAEAGAAPCAEG